MNINVLGSFEVYPHDFRSLAQHDMRYIIPYLQITSLSITKW